MDKRKDWRWLPAMGLLLLTAAILSMTAQVQSAKAARLTDVNIWENENGKYLFLPSWANMAAEKERYADEDDLTIMQSENLPSVEINTISGSLDRLLADKEAAESAGIEITLADGNLHYSGRISEFKTRGNSTWALDKKPFQFKLDEAADLFGMGSDRSWVLLANGYDETGVRSSLAFWLADQAGIAYTPESQLVDLYCNGEYQGCYLLCEKVQADSGRVEIGEGFLLQREIETRYQIAVYLEGQAGFQTDRGDYYLIESPKMPTKEQTERIAALVQDAEDAVFSEDGTHPETGKLFTEYLDLDSFVQKYLLEEVTKNYDGGVTSAFYYVPENEWKLHAGPPWDYDVCWGNCTLDEINSNPEGVTELADHVYGTGLYSALMDQDLFYQKVISEFGETWLPLLESLTENVIDEACAYSGASLQMDHTRWSDMVNRYQYYESYEDNVRYLKYFVENRTSFLKEVWMDGTVYHRITMMVEDHVWKRLYVKDGAVLGELPVPYLQNHVFAGWYIDEDTKYDPYRPVFEEMILKPLWAEY